MSLISLALIPENDRDCRRPVEGFDRARIFTPDACQLRLHTLYSAALATPLRQGEGRMTVHARPIAFLQPFHGAAL